MPREDKNARWPWWGSAIVLAGVLAFLALLLAHFDRKYGSHVRPSLPGPPAAIPADNRADGKPPRPRGAPAWVKIRYDDLIDREDLTHSGKTVGQRLGELSRSGRKGPDGSVSDLQPFLEPFSFVCNDVASAAGPPDATAYRNVAEEYPAGSRQPAWAAMARGGIFQLFAGGGKARLFLKGEDPAILFERAHGVVRHPLSGIMESVGVDRLTVEVFAFRNDYASRTIHLDIRPYVLSVTREGLAPAKTPLSLPRLDEFFRQGVTLEAAGVEGDGDLYLYGSPSSPPTVAGHPLSLSDFAVVYRSVFHNGGNAPYVSLDRNEDNRYAKVNFGGFLEDTRVGSVVLEADRLFKAICTGLDPGTRRPVQGAIRAAIPDFLTAAERGLRAGVTGDSEVRYWFYPDRIRTVTDGKLGAVRNYRFTADAERVDRKAPLGRDQRETIDHLNRNYDRYAAVFPVYRELDTVGRMMAIANWLLKSGIGGDVDLDALLSVELPGFRTPRSARKLLAVAAEAYPQGEAGARGEPRRKTYSLDELLDGMKPTATEREMVDAAIHRFAQMRDPELHPGYSRADPGATEAAKARVGEFEARHPSLRELREIGNMPNTLVSVGGGVDLRPRDFANPVREPDSPLIRRIRESRDIVRSSPPVGEGKKRTPPPGKGEVSAEPRPSKTPGNVQEMAARPVRKEVVVRSPAYPGEIVAIGEFSAGGTIVLRRGKSPSAPIPR